MAENITDQINLPIIDDDIFNKIGECNKDNSFDIDRNSTLCMNKITKEISHSTLPDENDLFSEYQANDEKGNNLEQHIQSSLDSLKDDANNEPQEESKPDKEEPSLFDLLRVTDTPSMLYKSINSTSEVKKDNLAFSEILNNKDNGEVIESTDGTINHVSVNGKNDDAKTQNGEINLDSIVNNTNELDSDNVKNQDNDISTFVDPLPNSDNIIDDKFHKIEEISNIAVINEEQVDVIKDNCSKISNQDSSAHSEELPGNSTIIIDNSEDDKIYIETQVIDNIEEDTNKSFLRDSKRCGLRNRSIKNRKLSAKSKLRPTIEPSIENTYNIKNIKLKDCRVNLGRIQVNEDDNQYKKNINTVKRKLEDMLHSAQAEEEKGIKEIKKMKQERSKLYGELLREINRLKNKVRKLK